MKGWSSSEHEPTALERIKQVLHHFGTSFKQSSRITSSLTTVDQSSLQIFGVIKWSSSLSYPRTSFTHTPPNDFPSRTDAALELPVLINPCLHSGSINTQPFEGNGIGLLNYCNPITFTSFPHSNISVMEVIRKILIRLKYRPAMQ